MTEELSHAEIQELLGAYALDAVDERERSIIAAHLPTCESCRLELDDHRRLAETLRRHAVRVSPLASSESNGSPTNNHPVERPARLFRAAVPVALAVIALLVGAVFVQGQVRYDQLTATTGRVERLERAQLATTDPGAIITALRTPNEDPVMTVVDRGGASYAINSSLPRLGGGENYELWRVDTTGAVASVGSLGADPDAVVISLPADVTGYLITVEHNPTPSRPTLPAIANSGGTTP